MGFVGDIIDGLTGKTAKKASESAGRIQADAAVEAAEIEQETAREGIAAQQEALQQLRSDLRPFVGFGGDAIGELSGQLDQLNTLTSDADAQAAFIRDNPFFKAVADDAQRRLLNNQAAKGKVGSGDTAKGLFNQLLIQGNDFLNQGINRLLSSVNASQNAVTTGQNAAARTGSGAVQTGNAISNLLLSSGRSAAGGITGAANSLAAGLVGGANAQQQGLTNLLTLGTVALCDRRFKINLNKAGETDNGIPLYVFNYVGHDELILGPMAQDVEEVQPSAVLDLLGVKYVDFSRLKCRSIH